MSERSDVTLVVGAGGMLGRAVVQACGTQVATAGRAELEGATQSEIDSLVARRSPSVVINCAADVDAEGAERDSGRAHAANALLPEHLARACARSGALLVQVSSTGCYGSWKSDPYTEDDPAVPTTAHHRTKLAGEEAVRALAPDHLIARVGWLYGGCLDRPRNFVRGRLLEALNTDTLQADAEQTGCPSDVADVARQLLHAVAGGARGIANIVTQGRASRYEYVKRIVDESRLPCRVVPGPAFRRLAPVSPNESAVNLTLQRLGLDIMPHWTHALTDYMQGLWDSGSIQQFKGRSS